VHEGDTITIDAPSLSRNLHVGNEELAKRRAAWTLDATRQTLHPRRARQVRRAGRQLTLGRGAGRGSGLMPNFSAE
jgi:dihydroxyacid dehydratase/phosphogluconate dehydratase